jgi:cobalt-zinc-cadmium efflux system outer membrane protein
MLTRYGDTLWPQCAHAKAARAIHRYAACVIACTVLALTGGCCRLPSCLNPYCWFHAEGDIAALTSKMAAADGPYSPSVQGPGTELNDVSIIGSNDSFAAAGGPAEFTVERALLYTLENHPRLRARAQEVEVARAALISAGIIPNPQFVVDAETPINESGTVELSGRLMFTIPTGGKRGYAAAAAKAGIVEAQAAIDSEAQILLTETAAAALEVLYLQELVKLQRDLAALAGEAAALERARVEGAVAGALDALAAEINAAEIDFNTYNNETLLAIARIRLSRAMGLVRPEAVVVSGNLAVQPLQKLPLGDLLAEAVRVRPELAQAEAAIVTSRRDAVAARAAAIPDVELGPLYATELGEQQDTLGVRFGTDLPWFDRGQGDVYEAASQAKVNEALRDEVQVTTLHDVANAYQQLRPIEQALARYEETIVPLTRKTEALLRDTDAARILDAVELSDELRKLGQIRLKHLELRYQHNQIRTTLELLLGRRLAAAETAAETPAAEEVQPGRPDQAPMPPGELLEDEGTAGPQDGTDKRPPLVSGKPAEGRTPE